MDTKTILAMLLRDALKTIAGALVLHGWVNSGTAEALIGLGMLCGASTWSFWVTSGRAMAQAALEILQAKVLNAAAKARANPTAAAPALASVAAHVVSTLPAGAPAAAATPPAASLILLAIGLSALAIAWAGPAGAECMSWIYDLQGNRACTLDDAVNRSPYIFLAPPTISGDGKTYTTNSAPRCIVGYEAVTRSNGMMACARDFMDPQ